MRKKYKIIIIVLVLISSSLYILNNLNNGKYILKEYNPSGQLLGTNEYILRNGDTVLQGKFVNYNDKGVKISEGQFVENEPYGECIYYNEKGDKQVVHFRKNSSVTLESTFYNPKGFIEKYILYDDLGDPAFIISFDEKGATKYDGHFQVEIYQYKYANSRKFNINDRQYLKVGDTLKYSYLIANIPNAKRSFVIENLDIDNSKAKRILKRVPPAQIDIKEVLTQKGKNTIRSIVKYEFDDNSTPTFTDTLLFDVNVH